MRKLWHFGKVIVGNGSMSFLVVLSFLLCCNTSGNTSTRSLGEEKQLEVSKKYFLSIACIFKNDADYLKEWIEYHRLVGVEHFYLFNNDSDDHSKEVLRPYVEEEIVTLTDWKDGGNEANSKKPYAWVFSTQVPALEYACNIYARHESKWIAFIDSDEFLVPIQADNVVDILKSHDDEVGVAICWKIFGTSNVKQIEKNQLMMEVLTKCLNPENDFKSEKTIAKT